MRKIVLATVLIASSGPIYAAELVHTFVNPNFGGNPLNANGLLANANAQNKYEADEAATQSNQRSATQTAKDNYNRQVLSKLVSLSLSNDFGSGTTPSIPEFPDGVDEIELGTEYLLSRSLIGEGMYEYTLLDSITREEILKIRN